MAIQHIPFRFIKETEEETPHIEIYDNVLGRDVYKSTFKESLMVIHDEDRDIYHEFDYEGINPFIDKELKEYVRSYNDKQKEE